MLYFTIKELTSIIYHLIAKLNQAIERSIPAEQFVCLVALFMKHCGELVKAYELDFQQNPSNYGYQGGIKTFGMDEKVPFVFLPRIGSFLKENADNIGWLFCFFCNDIFYNIEKCFHDNNAISNFMHFVSIFYFMQNKENFKFSCKDEYLPQVNIYLDFIRKISDAKINFVFAELQIEMQFIEEFKNEIIGNSNDEFREHLCLRFEQLSYEYSCLNMSVDDKNTEIMQQIKNHVEKYGTEESINCNVCFNVQILWKTLDVAQQQIVALFVLNECFSNVSIDLRRKYLTVVDKFVTLDLFINFLQTLHVKNLNNAEIEAIFLCVVKEDMLMDVIKNLYTKLINHSDDPDFVKQILFIGLQKITSEQKHELLCDMLSKIELFTYRYQSEIEISEPRLLDRFVGLKQVLSYLCQYMTEIEKHSEMNYLQQITVSNDKANNKLAISTVTNVLSAERQLKNEQQPEIKNLHIMLNLNAKNDCMSIENALDVSCVEQLEEENDDDVACKCCLLI